MRMLRLIGSVIFGFAVWTIAWLLGNAAILSMLGGPDEEGVYDDPAPLIGALVLSVVCSLLAGVVCAAVLRTGRLGPPVVLALLLLLTGVGVQIGNWEMMPLWYHISFLILLAPVTIAGAMIARPRRTESTAD